MIEKLNAKRAEGRDGWQDPEACPMWQLEGLYKGKLESDPDDYLDIAIYAMMLHFRTQEV